MKMFKYTWNNLYIHWLLKVSKPSAHKNLILYFPLEQWFRFHLICGKFIFMYLLIFNIVHIVESSTYSCELLIRVGKVEIWRNGSRCMGQMFRVLFFSFLCPQRGMGGSHSSQSDCIINCQTVSVPDSYLMTP